MTTATAQQPLPARRLLYDDQHFIVAWLVYEQLERHVSLSDLAAKVAHYHGIRYPNCRLETRITTKWRTKVMGRFYVRYDPLAFAPKAWDVVSQRIMKAFENQVYTSEDELRSILQAEYSARRVPSDMKINWKKVLSEFYVRYPLTLESVIAKYKSSNEEANAAEESATPAAAKAAKAAEKAVKAAVKAAEEAAKAAEKAAKAVEKAEKAMEKAAEEVAEKAERAAKAAAERAAKAAAERAAKAAAPRTKYVPLHMPEPAGFPTAEHLAMRVTESFPEGRPQSWKVWTTRLEKLVMASSSLTSEDADDAKCYERTMRLRASQRKYRARVRNIIKSARR
ncbi:hypothetical protein GGF41_000459, partial [Coemansia sp. RSA 2531]